MVDAQTNLVRHRLIELKFAMNKLAVKTSLEGGGLLYKSRARDLVY